MRQKTLLRAALAVLLFATAPQTAKAGLDVSEMAALQATMQQYVDHKTVDGAYLYFDLDRAEVRELYPVTGHPMVMQFDDSFVLCFDFVDAAGEKVEVDYYLARKNEGFVVFHEAVGTRTVLKAMMSEGRVKPVN